MGIDKGKQPLSLNSLLELNSVWRRRHSRISWFPDSERITRDKESGIVNDPNAWFEDPRDLVVAIRRIVYVSLETARIVEGLPEPFDPAERLQGTI